MTRPALIGDIGGTNARFALVTPGAFAPHDILSLPCADYPGIIEAVRDYLDRVGAHGEHAPREACLALACPVHGERVVMTNNHWDFTRTEVRDALNLELFKVINDFMAQALGVPHVAEGERVTLQAGHCAPHATRLVIGPGTGLGVAGVFPGRHDWIPLPTEGGHVTFAPTDEREQNLLRHFRNRYGRISVERLLSGQGLLDLYVAHCSLKGANPQHRTPAEVTAAAGSGDPVARDTLLRFLKILGDVSGDAALTMGARGGVYLCGGILPRLLDWLPDSRFLEAFHDKGRMRDYTASLPVQVVTAPWTGLLGAAEALHNPEVE
ncbi:glucokinase [Halomonas sp. 18H]|uniref:glucokinase n=1 Tax=Halomonas almeriensis TaxID=308163 RepID=UPI00222EC13F|nr:MULTISPECIES: glucokinase [Halomonas]MCW4149598.1 glucokinase [Halomonas sp. 18H]MDN3553456.1 glucokinase [Halomonas almeriensis]